MTLVDRTSPLYIADKLGLYDLKAHFSPTSSIATFCLAVTSKTSFASFKIEYRSTSNTKSDFSGLVEPAPDYKKNFFDMLLKLKQRYN